MFHTVSGTLEYNAKSLSGKAPRNDWWAIVRLQPGLIQMYKSLMKMDGIIVELPAFGAHVSVLKGERPLKNADQWGKNNRCEIEFQYSDQIMTDGYWWFLAVTCPELSDMRSYYGLSPKPYGDFHITVGRTSINNRIHHYDGIVLWSHGGEDAVVKIMCEDGASALVRMPIHPDGYRPVAKDKVVCAFYGTHGKTLIPKT